MYGAIYHSVSVPDISASAYLTRHLLRMGLALKEDMTEATLLHTMCLLERLHNSQASEGFHLCTANVHRVLLALMVRSGPRPAQRPSHHAQHILSALRSTYCRPLLTRPSVTRQVISAKLVDDEPYTNTYWASVGGVDLQHLNDLEIYSMKSLDHHLNVSSHEMEVMYSRLLSEVELSAAA